MSDDVPSRRFTRASKTDTPVEEEESIENTEIEGSQVEQKDLKDGVCLYIL